jgi:hypothetical protein
LGAVKTVDGSHPVVRRRCAGRSRYCPPASWSPAARRATSSGAPSSRASGHQHRREVHHIVRQRGPQRYATHFAQPSNHEGSQTSERLQVRMDRLNRMNVTSRSAASRPIAARRGACQPGAQVNPTQSFPFRVSLPNRVGNEERNRFGAVNTRERAGIESGPFPVPIRQARPRSWLRGLKAHESPPRPHLGPPQGGFAPPP